jgi:PAS domain-containing protein
MPFSARTTSGLLLTATAALAAIAADLYFTVTLDLAPLFVGLVVCAAALGGIGAGLAGAAIAVGCVVLLALVHGAPSGFRLADLIDLALLAIGATMAAIVTGMLRTAAHKASRRERARHATARRLAAALDQTGIGIVLLDADTRAEFINRAFRDLFAVPDALADSNPPFIALMYHGRDTRAYALPDDELDGFIARRTEMIRAGDTTPFDIRLSSGIVVRLSCMPLPDGSRMLSYTPITDLIRRSDNPTDYDRYLALRGTGDVFADGRLHAAE